MNAAFQSSLSNVESKLNALLTTITTAPAAAGAPAAAAALLEVDDTLSTSIDTLRLHQENHATILRLRAEAERLERRVKDIVKSIEEFDKGIQSAYGDDSDSDRDSIEEGTSNAGIKPRKEIDYRLLLDFARRISKYNHEAAADAANGIAAQKSQETAVPDLNGEANNGAEPVATVTKSATQWLDDSANSTREVYMLPYPMEDRIRMGLMGQVQLAAGQDLDKEVDRLIREAEGLGAAEPVAPAPAADARQEQSANAAAQAGSDIARAPAPRASAPRPPPKATLDLDLYDPDDDDM
ncbi:hypothetical protein N7468_009731 [Penicillium chermesinum]|uniref:Mediator of RNA polymerase II transcription subunit 4 n=1 Tax=Penicillium chermesinum TaxID=63820 RepID=A0A9W9NIB5_9EURO|nr:uncharacterized protein N7468_009731 [Penicillium chermesinum]KAJ5220527.1 hypothetical protein N7468_009731 [Penicillium chermesinum]